MYVSKHTHTYMFACGNHVAIHTTHTQMFVHIQMYNNDTSYQVVVQ